jgi:hypothetical protein
MTEALRKWVAEQERKADPDDWGMVHALSVSAAEFWIDKLRAEVEKRAKSVNAMGRDPKIRQAFDDLTRELLGGDNAD